MALLQPLQASKIYPDVRKPQLTRWRRVSLLTNNHRVLTPQAGLAELTPDQASHNTTISNGKKICEAALLS